MIKKEIESQEREVDELDDNDEEVDMDIQALIPAYLESRKKDLETIKDAFNKKELAIIAKLVHNIKGTALSYKQDKLDKIAKAMEVALHGNRPDEVELYIGKMSELLRDKNGN